MEILDDEVRPHISGEPRHYVLYSRVPFEFFVSVATVKARVSHMLEKLELNNRVQIALLAHDADVA